MYELFKFRNYSHFPMIQLQLTSWATLPKYSLKTTYSFHRGLVQRIYMYSTVFLVSSISLIFLVDTQALLEKNAKVAIIQNNGGGHGSIGFQLCKHLIEQKIISKPSMLHIAQDNCNYNNPPFSSYRELSDVGVHIWKHDLKQKHKEAVMQLIDVGPEYLIDNWSKTASDMSVTLEVAKACTVKQLIHVSSAGIYRTGGNLAPLLETDPVLQEKVRLAECAVVDSGVPYTIFRPQYIYGTTKSSKRFLDYFIERATQEAQQPVPIPIPHPGDQLVCLTHIDDAVSMIAASLGSPAALNQIFNCGSDRYITYKGLCQLVHQAAGNSPQDGPTYSLYDPSSSTSSSGRFPFRSETFITSPAKAQMLLRGWQAAHCIQDDLQAEVQDYLYLSQK